MSETSSLRGPRLATEHGFRVEASVFCVDLEEDLVRVHLSEIEGPLCVVDEGEVHELGLVGPREQLLGQLQLG